MNRIVLCLLLFVSTTFCMHREEFQPTISSFDLYRMYVKSGWKRSNQAGLTNKQQRELDTFKQKFFNMPITVLLFYKLIEVKGITSKSVQYDPSLIEFATNFRELSLAKQRWVMQYVDVQLNDYYTLAQLEAELNDRTELLDVRFEEKNNL